MMRWTKSIQTDKRSYSGVAQIAALILSGIFLFSPFFNIRAYADQNSVTIIDQQDREIEYKQSDPRPKSGLSILTGTASKAIYQPILVEFNNENGGIDAAIPYGINQASIIYEYQVNTNGTTGICALFQDELPSGVGPLGDASVGGVMVQNDWDCGYIYNGLPIDSEGNLSELGYSIRSWLLGHNITKQHVLFPTDVARFKEWMKYVRTDESIFTAYRNFVDLPGIQALLENSKNTPINIPYSFLGAKDAIDSDISIMEIDIGNASRTYYSGFVYNPDERQYYRYVGKTQYLDGITGEQLTLSNLIIQRVNYVISNGLMAPSTIGKGNAEIFIEGKYIEGYWVRESTDDHTRFYDGDGNPITLMPGKTFISFQSYQTPIILIDW